MSNVHFTVIFIPFYLFIYSFGLYYYYYYICTAYYLDTNTSYLQAEYKNSETKIKSTSLQLTQML